jgi:hypothetical protein
MKKLFALLLVLLIALCFSVPLITAAEAPAAAPPDSGQAAALVPTEAPMVASATEAAQETEPGGAPAQIDFTPLLQAFVGVLALIITRYIIPWLRSVTTAEQLDKIDYWTRIAVAAAEKAYGAGHGAEKLADATEYLKTKGIVIDDKIVDALIQEFFESSKQPKVTAL